MRSFGSVLAVLLAALVILSASSVAVADEAEDNVTMEGYVLSVIKGNDTYLKDASITVTGTDGTVYKATTNDKGYFILSCPIGTYSLTAKCGGFNDVTIENIESGVGTIDIHMDLRDTAVIWNLDIPHLLEIIGLAFVFGILVIGAILIRLLSRSSKITVINDADDPLADLEDLEELEGEYEEEEYVYDEELKES